MINMYRERHTRPDVPWERTTFVIAGIAMVSPARRILAVNLTILMII